MSVRSGQTLHISTYTILRFFGILFLFTGLYIVRDVILSLLFAVIIASGLEPAVVWLGARRIPRILAVVLLYLLIGGVLFLAAYFVSPLLLESVESFLDSSAGLQEQILERVRGSGFISRPFTFPGDLRSALNLPLSSLSGFGSGLVNFVGTIFGGLVSFILVAVLSFYLTAQERGIENFLRLVTPLAHEQYVIGLWGRAQAKLGRWLRAQLLLGMIVGVLIFFGLSLLEIEHALIFALLAAAFEIIPIVGPILAAVPAVITAFLSSPGLGIGTIVLYIIVQQLESHIFVPVVMRRATGLRPLVVVLALVVGAKFGGIVGIFLAVPLTAVVAEFVDDWDKKKRAIMPE
ncbi:MAG: hypothetical protein G01um101466_13 [Parcubacteria group bacterium Gr01-1014_66]|nr:MAG: hypothetical protein G01um101466_13 [Parcubacteria group bacterium Gr01-1014_66]